MRIACISLGGGRGGGGEREEILANVAKCYWILFNLGKIV